MGGGESMTTVGAAELPDFKPAPNQGGNIELYEAENRALDPDGHVLAAMRARAPWAGRTLLDLGGGGGGDRGRAGPAPAAAGGGPRSPGPGAARVGRAHSAGGSVRRRGARAVRLLLPAPLRRGARRGDAGAAPRRHARRRRERPAVRPVRRPAARRDGGARAGRR